MSQSSLNVLQVVQSHMCMGCGACAFACPSKLQMQDTQNLARRPGLVELEVPTTAELEQATAICPGIQWPAAPECPTEGHPELYDEWGPILEIWEGNSTDDEIRFKGSSGGVVTGLALACMVIDAPRQVGIKHGVREVELSWILEDNLAMRNILDNLGSKPYKRYRIYGKTL